MWVCACTCTRAYGPSSWARLRGKRRTYTYLYTSHYSPAAGLRNAVHVRTPSALALRLQVISTALCR